MYSTDITQIRQGLVSYIGAILKASSLEGRAARQDTAAVLVEESLKLAQEEDKTLDIFVLKPILRATSLVLKQRCSELSSLPGKETSTKSNEYQRIAKELDKLVASIKE